MQPRHVWIDGRVVPADAPQLTVFDRGFQLGDGIFETLRARGGRPTELDEHVARLRSSAEGLEIPLPADIRARLDAGIADLLEAEGLGGPNGDASIRITVSRGPFQARGVLPAEEGVAPTIVIQAWPVPAAAPAADTNGVHLVTSSVRRDPRSPLVRLKTTSRADYVYARLEARRAGADDALFLTVDGRLSEATSANLFLVRRGAGGRPQLATPSLDCAILPGTTRSWLLSWGAGARLDPFEGDLTPEDLAAADEAFLSSSVAGIVPVIRVDGRAVGDGQAGSWTHRARADREAFIRQAELEPADRA
jgi:branched-chain amino acid aminotransferase